jgi:hypothetical protein
MVKHKWIGFNGAEPENHMLDRWIFFNGANTKTTLNLTIV